MVNENERAMAPEHFDTTESDPCHLLWSFPEKDIEHVITGRPHKREDDRRNLTLPRPPLPPFERSPPLGVLG